jgi:hypothetical protein
VSYNGLTQVYRSWNILCKSTVICEIVIVIKESEFTQSFVGIMPRRLDEESQVIKVRELPHTFSLERENYKR